MGSIFLGCQYNSTLDAQKRKDKEASARVPMLIKFLAGRKMMAVKCGGPGAFANCKPITEARS